MQNRTLLYAALHKTKFLFWCDQYLITKGNLCVPLQGACTAVADDPRPHTHGPRNAVVLPATQRAKQMHKDDERLVDIAGPPAPPPDGR